MSVGKICDVAEKDGYSQLMCVGKDGELCSLLLTPRELSMCLDRAKKNADALAKPTLIDRLIYFLLRVFKG